MKERKILHSDKQREALFSEVDLQRLLMSYDSMVTTNSQISMRSHIAQHNESTPLTARILFKAALPLLLLLCYAAAIASGNKKLW